METSSAPRILVVSNGHGEDVVGVRIAGQIASRLPAATVEAFPLVGTGGSYREHGIAVIGPTREMPSGGLLMHSLPLFLQDLRAGILSHTVRQCAFLAGRRSDALVVVGDIFAQAMASLVHSRHRVVVQTLISARHWQEGSLTSPNRLFMERITVPERLLMRWRADRVFVRDPETERSLVELGVGNAVFAGNPLVDGLAGQAPESLKGRRTVLLLPGSRTYAQAALDRMLGALELLPDPAPALALAWAPEEPPVPPSGWSYGAPAASEPGLVGELTSRGASVLVFRRRFVDLLHAATVVLGTAGTAHEQAVALARPVVSFPVPPHYSAAFLENQARLLGPALTVTDGTPGAIAGTVRSLLGDPARADLAARQGQARLGRPGGSGAVAEEVVRALATGATSKTK